MNADIRNVKHACKEFLKEIHVTGDYGILKYAEKTAHNIWVIMMIGFAADSRIWMLMRVENNLVVSYKEYDDEETAEQMFDRLIEQERREK